MYFDEARVIFDGINCIHPSAGIWGAFPKNSAARRRTLLLIATVNFHDFRLGIFKEF